MVTPAENHNARPVWYVNANAKGVDDQFTRFVENGIWESPGNNPKDAEIVSRDIHPGDRIAIRSTYRRVETDAPFNSNEPVYTMAIRAVGTVTENFGDGRLSIDWHPVDPPRKWYFLDESYPYSGVIRVPRARARDEKAEHDASLISFTFDYQPQDIDRWRNDPQYRDRCGDQNPTHLPGPPNQPMPPEPSATYTIDSILAEGCFLPQPTLETMLQRLRAKQNLILQGPPGTGKTWLAKRLAYALTGRKDDSKVRPMQFHPNLSYEDFVRGWRPQGDGRLELVDGPFLQVVEDAREDPDSEYVMVIEEINRGNPASIFGEMLTLLEADKRNPDEALALAYPREIGERVHIPPNVYVIGTMNLADRSLAMVDLALRRRFAFFDLEPMLNDTWRQWVHEQCGIDDAFLNGIAQRIDALNEDIATDRNLGRQFRIGHSFVTPAPGSDIGEPEVWFAQVVETEIVPLLHEYWFDNPDRVAEARSKLLGIT